MLIFFYIPKDLVSYKYPFIMKLTNFLLATVLMALGSAADVDKPLVQRECLAGSSPPS